jgi:DNA-binding response OmpR family regulator
MRRPISEKPEGIEDSSTSDGRPSSPPASSKTAAKARKRILVVDDDAEFCTSTQQILEAAGFDARHHLSPFGCLHAVRQMRCDLVILDINMPRLDGPLLLRMIRDSSGLGNIRILLCSNMEHHHLARIAKTCGADGFVPKDVAKSELVDRIQAVLSKRGTTAR